MRTFDDPLEPMGYVTARIASYWFDLKDGFEDRAAVAIPVGLLVGEQPRPGGNHKLPLWPWPPTCAGARLHQMSEMSLEEYFIRLARTNVSLHHVARWNPNGARLRANRILVSVPDGCRILTCGVKARNAFGLAEWFYAVPHDVDGKRIEVAAIPHPSGRCREYNHPEAVKEAGRWVRWAARLEEDPS